MQRWYRARRLAARFGPVIALPFLLGCSRDKPEERGRPRPTASVTTPAAKAPPLDLLYLGEDPALPPVVGDGLLPHAPGRPTASTGRCPAEMVDVRGQFCIDRFEVTLIDGRTQQELSPFYHPTRALTAAAYERYRHRAQGALAAPGIPDPPPHQLERDAAPLARSRASVTPQGYLNADLAESACRAAGKRLCSLSEWVTACRGEQDRKFPYGDRYVAGKCNVFRAAHPAVVIHRNASREHLDPRLNLVTDAEGPLLRKTGSLPDCQSRWGGDGVFDMVGNLDEWVADGSFVGGFYSRATREGCEARISSHAREYFDYSLGTRCCREPSGLR